MRNRDKKQEVVGASCVGFCEDKGLQLNCGVGLRAKPASGIANEVEIEDCQAGIWDWKLAERFTSPSAICNLQFLFFNLPFP